MYGLLDGCSPQCLIVQLEPNIERGEFDESEWSLISVGLTAQCIIISGLRTMRVSPSCIAEA